MPLLPWRTDSDGFAFSNSWTLDSTERAALSAIATPIAAQAPALLIPIFPPLALDPATMATISAAATIAANAVIATTTQTFGMCGGMAYASLDYWRAKAPIPCGGNVNDQPSRTVPNQASVRNMIWGRLLDSLGPGGALKNTILWSLVLNQLPPIMGGGGGTLMSWTVKEWIKIKATIDSGSPCPIGLLYNKRDIWNQHQILVYGYEDFGVGGKFYVYDNNFPHAFGDPSHTNSRDIITFDFKSPALTATSPGDNNDSLAGFFVTGYTPKTPPAGLAPTFGEFVNWTDDKRTWMPAYGAVLPIANATELATLGGSAAAVRPTNAPMPIPLPRPRDNALLREHSAAPVFLYEGGCPFHVPDPTTLNLFGGFAAVRVVPDNTLMKFAGPPDDGTLLRESSSQEVFQITNGIPTLVHIPPNNASVRMVFDGALKSLFLDSVSLSVLAVTVGGSCTGTVHLRTTFDRDLVVTLSSSPSNFVTMPATVTVLKNTLSANFSITTHNLPLGANTLGIAITATLGDTSKSATLNLRLPRIKTFTLSPATVTTGQSSTATITLESSYAVDIVVKLLSVTGFATVAPSFTFPKNSTSATFVVNTPASANSFPPAKADIQASYADVVADAILTVLPSVVLGIAGSIVLSPASVTSGGTTSGTVTLTAAVGTPTNVGLTSLAPGGRLGTRSPLVASITPTTVTIAAGATQGHFQVKTKVIASDATQRTAIIEAIAVKTVTATLTLT